MKCSPETSHRFLRNALSSAEEAQFEQHLEACESCRDALLVASGGIELESDVRRRLECSKELPAWSQAIGDSRMESAMSSRVATDDDRFPEASLAAELASLSPSDDPSSLGRIGLFEAKAILGRGGMGTVYKALDPALGRTVAIKILRPDLASIGSARHRFRLEAKAMASIAHPHVVPIYAVDDHRGLPYLAMEYVAGGTLESRLQNQGPFEILSVMRIVQQIASALQAAHECGLVHRDIKPANILLDRGVDRVRVTDFGLVRVSDDASMTRSGLIAGTPQYMAPEQVRGDACDRRSDLFSLGCVMYALLVGHPPFRANSPYAAMQRIVHDAPRPIGALRSDVPAWLIALIDRLLAKRPEHRFDSAGMVAEILESELAAIQNPEQIVAPKREWMRDWKANENASSATDSPVRGRALASREWLTAWQTWAAACGILVAMLGAVSVSPFVRTRLEAWSQSGAKSSQSETQTTNGVPRPAFPAQTSANTSTLPEKRSDGSSQTIPPQSSHQNSTSPQGLPRVLPPWNGLDTNDDNLELYQWRQRAEQLDRSLGTGESW